MTAAKILVIDDEENMRRSLKALLSREGYEVKTAFCGEEAMGLTRNESFPLLIADLKMKGMNGMEVYRAIREQNPRTLAIIITGHASLESAIQAIRLGAYDYLIKPFKSEELLLSIRRALEYQRLLEENIYLHRELRGQFQFDNIVGKSGKMSEVFEFIKKVAGTNVTVLLRGESGTGKELVARAVHYNSPRKERRFVTVSCGALPETLLESELFGHEKGAFTGALTRKRGLFEVADGGTIFLDELGDLSLATQMKLLRVLQEREFQRVGSTEAIKVDIRLISATNKDLEKAVKEGKFRKDLYYRINVVSLHLPPLRERKEDIPLLVQHFLRKHQEAGLPTPPPLAPETSRRAEQMTIPPLTPPAGGVKGESPPPEKVLTPRRALVKGVSAEAMVLMMNHEWPGNVRELENIVERGIALSSSPFISPKDLPPHLVRQLTGSGQPVQVVEDTSQSFNVWKDYPDDLTLKEARGKFEEGFLIKSLERSQGNVAVASRKINLSRRHFYEKMKSYGINPKKHKRAS